MDLSVIISTWNNSRRLELTLDAICRCVIPPELKWELVLVNNNCTDGTDEIAQEFTHKLPIVYVKEPRQGLSQARNTGIKTASGRLIVFTDDDVKPCREWIESYWSAFQERPTGSYFGGPVESEYETLKPHDELLPWAPPSVKGSNLGDKSRTLLPHEFFISANWACPREAIMLSGGFDIRKGLDGSSRKVRIGEETDLMKHLEKNGLSPWYLPAARIVHFVPAAKCCLKHVAARNEAAAFYDASKSTVDRQGPMIGGVPRWMYRTTFELWLKWVWAKAKGKKGYQETVKLRGMIGTMKGIRELSLNSRNISDRNDTAKVRD